MITLDIAKALCVTRRVCVCVCGVVMQQSQVAGTPQVARLKRWQRLLSKGRGVAGAWQEILRRYLLASRAALPVTESDMQSTDYAELSDDLAAVHVSRQRHSAAHDHGTSQKRCVQQHIDRSKRPHALYAYSCVSVSVCVQMAVSLGKMPYWRVPAALHLRTLSALMTDTINCKAMHDIMNTRCDAALEIQVRTKHHDTLDCREPCIQRCACECSQCANGTCLRS